MYLNALMRSPLSLLQAKQVQLSQCLCMREMLQTLIIFVPFAGPSPVTPCFPVLRSSEPHTEFQNKAAPGPGQRRPPRSQDGGAREGRNGAPGREGPGSAALSRPAPPDGLPGGEEGPQPGPAMSGAAEARELEERLREAAALGDVAEVRRLLGAGADIDSRNEINGWTCLHWACKRNHAQVVSCLLEAGADKQILTAKGELAAQLTSKPDIRKILGEEQTECQGVKDLNLSIVANHLANPFPNIYTEECIQGSLAESQNESASISSASQSETSPCPPAAQAESTCTPTSCSSGETLPAADAAARPAPVPNITAATACASPGMPHGPSCPPGTTPSLGLCSPGVPGQALPLQPHASPSSPAPAFQPFFFTGTFPYNVQELVLKVRVQNVRDNDFIEIELDRQELTYQDLLRVSCCELGVNPEQVEKIRKLPNTLLRNDKDVARLQDFQELELVLLRSESSPFRSAAAALMERPCYNSRASKLTY
ncbi:ankyrin repeat domain-containing protein 40-like isoform X2 [Passer domesticus]|uniref:ankyrin repeat domain-containing protein 40-like isoform X2 n=1 Tax=Passer domesticus TaxID=48849 RepID=UPI0030FEDB30